MRLPVLRGGMLGAVARLEALLAAIPQSLPLLALRVALAVPFFKSGLTKWDGFLQLSGGAVYLFTQEFKLHIFGAEIPYPYPLTMATLSGIGEIVLPILLVLGLGTRFAALGILAMTARDPAHRARRLGEFPSALGGDGADAGRLRRRQDRARSVDLRPALTLSWTYLPHGLAS